jgi:putative transposase
MPRGQRFPLEVMLRAMREVENGVPVGVVCRKVAMAEKTFYRYREKYQGMEATEARRLRELEEENAKLKKRPASSRKAVCYVQAAFGLSQRSACRASRELHVRRLGTTKSRLGGDGSGGARGAGG